MIVRESVTRRDFLRLRRSAQGRLLELSCRALFMRCSDAGLTPAPGPDYEPWMGEPPAVLHREPAAAILDRIERALGDVQIVRLLDAEWLPAMDGTQRLRGALAAFRQRGGRVELGRNRQHA